MVGNKNCACYCSCYKNLAVHIYTLTSFKIRIMSLLQMHTPIHNWLLYIRIKVLTLNGNQKGNPDENWSKFKLLLCKLLG